MSRTYSHWTFVYLWDRLMDKLHQRLHPNDPWLTPAVVQILDNNLTTNMIGLEFGSGRSTPWFARHLKWLTSVEHNQEWYEIVQKRLTAEGIKNVDQVMQDGSSGESYASSADRSEDNSLDFVLVDGIDRGECATRVLDKIKPGGYLVIDDVHRYLPSESRAPFARTHEDGPVDQYWQKFLDQVMDWEYVWTSNGVKDTVIYIKPMVD